MRKNVMCLIVTVLAELGHYRDVIRWALTLPFVTLNPGVSHVVGEVFGCQDEIDAHPVIFRKTQALIIPVGIYLWSGMVRSNHIGQTGVFKGPKCGAFGF